MWRLTVTLLSLVTVVSAFSSYSIIEKCRSGASVKSITLYRYDTDPTDITEFQLSTSKDSAGDIAMGSTSPCVVYIKNPAAPSGTTFQFEVTFDQSYSVGVDPATNQPKPDARGLKIQDNQLQYFVGTHGDYWKGKQSTAGNLIHGTALPATTTITRSGNTAGNIITLRYKGTVPDDTLKMRVKMTCTPGPCPTEPAQPTTATTTPTTPSSPKSSTQASQASSTQRPLVTTQKSPPTTSTGPITSALSVVWLTLIGVIAVMIN